MARGGVFTARHAPHYLLVMIDTHVFLQWSRRATEVHLVLWRWLSIQSDCHSNLSVSPALCLMIIPSTCSTAWRSFSDVGCAPWRSDIYPSLPHSLTTRSCFIKRKTRIVLRMNFLSFPFLPSSPPFVSPCPLLSFPVSFPTCLTRFLSPCFLALLPSFLLLTSLPYLFPSFIPYVSAFFPSYFTDLPSFPSLSLSTSLFPFFPFDLPFSVFIFNVIRLALTFRPLVFSFLTFLLLPLLPFSVLPSFKSLTPSPFFPGLLFVLVPP